VAARKLGPLNDSERPAAIEERDGEVVLLAHGIRHPGIVLGGVTKAIRLGERGTVAQIITILV
jgi:hypothetical protein